jgi:hypothetical protein
VSAAPRAVKLMVSTPLTSMTMPATSRANRTRLPLAVMSIVLGDVGAVELKRIGAGLALDDVAAVARVPDEGIVAGRRPGCRCRGRR